MWCYSQINSVSKSMALTMLEKGVHHITTFCLHAQQAIAEELKPASPQG